MGGLDGSAAELKRWAEAEMMPWRMLAITADDAETSVQSSVEQDPSVFRFGLRDRTVTFHEKSPETYLKQLPNEAFYQALRARGLQYQKFLQSVVTALDIVGTAELAIDLDDIADQTSAGPVFCFQKLSGSRAILLPDVDLLSWDFYLARSVEDEVPFAAKRDAAIFVGSTTGMLNISRTIVEQLAHPRLRSAVYFKPIDDVCFELPGIVQCDGPETEAMIESLQLGAVHRTWAEQFTYRYLISMDGNGATCSRVAISLKSDGVLVRYRSNHELYYFHGLQRWRHYVPVDSDADVIDNLSLLRRSPGLPEAIAAASRTFYRDCLSRIAVMHYTGELLLAYIARFGVPAPALPNGPIFAIDSSGVSGDHEAWAEPNGWFEAADGQVIQGIRLIPGPEIAAEDVLCRTVDADGVWSANAPGWQLCGSGGQHRPICGLLIQLRGSAADRFSLHYEARFLDGSRVGPTSSGITCASPDGSPLVAYRLHAYRR